MKYLKMFKKFYDSWTGTIILVLLFIFTVAQAFVIPSGSMKNSLLVGDFLFVKKFSYGIPTPHLPFIEIPILPDFKGNGHLIEGDRPKREDIVVFRYPHDPKMHYVKRCVAIGGDEVVYANKTLYVRMHEGDEFMQKNYKDNIVKLNGKMYVKEPYEKGGIHYDKDIYTDMVIKKSIALGNFAMKPIFISELPTNEIFDNGTNAFYYNVPEDEFFMVGDNRDHSEDSRFWGSVPYKYIEGKPWFVYFSWENEDTVAMQKSIDEKYQSGGMSLETYNILKDYVKDIRQNKNYKIRWERMFKSVETLQNEDEFIHDSKSDVRVKQN